MQNVLKIFYIQVFICLACLAASAQTINIDTAKLNTPGPANLDTNKLATIYLVRPDNEIARTLWMGIYFDDTLMVRVDDDMHYIIKYAKTGNVIVWVKNPVQSSVTLNIEAGKKYYLQMLTEVGGKTGNTTLVQLDGTEGEEAFKKIIRDPLYVYDPDPFTNSYYIFPSAPKVGYAHLKFSFPLSTRHFFENTLSGFNFSYYNRNVSPTFSEVDGVWGSAINFSDEQDFKKYAAKRLNDLKKSSGKSATIESITEDSLTSNADYIYSVYFTEKDSKPNVKVNGQTQVLELRQFTALIYKKSSLQKKGDVYSIYFSERGLPEELHSKEEIRFKIQQLLSSCEFGDFKN